MTDQETTYEFHSPNSLENVAQQLPMADDRPIFWDDPSKDGPRRDEIDGHKAVYNPATGDLYGIVTADYEVINPEAFLLPLVDEIRERERNDVEGEFRVYDGGAYGFGSLLFDTDAIYPPDRSRSDSPVRVGMTVRYSHDGGISVRASGFAQDGMCRNTMRRVTDSVYVKHAGDVGSRVNWRDEWATVLSQLGTFSERLAGVIEDAMFFEMYDLSEHDFEQPWLDATNPQNAIEDVPAPTGVSEEQIRGLHGFYDYLGFPRYLCLSAVDRLSWRLTQADDPRVVSAWDAYQGITYALSHDARFEAGSSSDDDYHRIASDILSNPVKALEDAQRGLADRLSEDDDEQAITIESTVGEALSSYEEREQRIREAMQAEET